MEEGQRSQCVLCVGGEDLKIIRVTPKDPDDAMKELPGYFQLNSVDCKTSTQTHIHFQFLNGPDPFVSLNQIVPIVVFFCGRQI